MCAVAVNENLPANGYLSVHTPPRWARHYGDVPGSTLLLCFLFLFFHFIWLFFSVAVVVVVVWFSSFSGDFRMKKRCSGYRTSWQCRLTWCNLMSLFTMGIAPILGHDTWWVNAENAEHVVRTALVKIRKQLMTTWKTNEKSNKTTRTRTWLGRKIARVCSMKRQPVRKNKKEKRNVFTSVRKPLLTAKFAKCRRISCRVPFAIGQKRYWPLTSSVDIEKWAQLFWKKSKKMTVNCSFDSSPLLRKARGVKWNQVIAVRFEKEPVRNWNWISIKIELTSPPNGKVDGRNRSSDFFIFLFFGRHDVPRRISLLDFSFWLFILKKKMFIFSDSSFTFVRFIIVCLFFSLVPPLNKKEKTKKNKNFVKRFRYVDSKVSRREFLLRPESNEKKQNETTKERTNERERKRIRKETSQRS